MKEIKIKSSKNENNENNEKKVTIQELQLKSFHASMKLLKNNFIINENKD